MGNHIQRETIQEKCKRYGINYKTFCFRFYHNGMSEEEALTKPVNDQKTVIEKRKRIIFLFRQARRAQMVSEQLGYPLGLVQRVIRMYLDGSVDENGELVK